MKKPLIKTIIFLLSLIAGYSHADSPVMDVPRTDPEAILLNETSEVTVSATVISPGSNLKKVTVEIKESLKWEKLGKLEDKGINGDSLANDGTYSWRFKFSPKKSGKIYL